MLPIVRYLPVCIALAVSFTGISSAQHTLPWRTSSGPVYFEPNTSLHSEEVLYFARGLAYSLELTHDAVVMRFSDGAPLRMNFPYSELDAAGMLPGKSNYYLGAPRTGVPHFARVRYRSVFPGVDMVIYNAKSGIEYDWIVAPGADPAAVRFSFTGARDIRLNQNGDLVLETAAGQVRHRSPRVYQEGGGGERDIAGGFVVEGDSVRFRLGEYDRQRALIIDPQIVFAAAMGASYRVDSGTLHRENNSAASGVALDRAGNVYVSGSSVSCNTCIFVTKLNPEGTQVLYDTVIPAAQLQYLGPGHHPYSPSAIAGDPDGNVYVTVLADAASLSAAGGKLTSAGGIDMLLAKFDPAGKLKATMVIGGSKDDRGTAITLGPDGYLYVAGTTMSQDFPTSPNAFRADRLGPLNFFALKVDPKALDGETPRSRAVVYSALLGTYSVTHLPINSSRIESSPTVNIGADASGNAYVSAYTDCTGLTATAGALQTNCLAAFPDRPAAVVLKLDRMGAKILWAAIPFGSSGAFIDRLVVTSQGAIYAGGGTSPGFPVTGNAFRKSALTLERTTTAFVAKINSDGTAFGYATYLDACCGVGGLAVDSAGNAVVTGYGGTAQFPVIQGFQAQPGGYLCVLKPDGGGLVWSTFLGRGVPSALALDAAGNVYVAGSGINPGKAASLIRQSGPIWVLKISPDGAPALIDGVAESAAFGPGLPRPGGLASIFVHGLNVPGQVLAAGPPFPTELAGVRMFAGGVPAPILSISNIGLPGAPGSQQVNLQVPFESAGSFVEMRYQGLSSYAIPDTGAPGIFTLADGSGAIQHASGYSLVTPQDPVRKGEVIIVYATGLGPVWPPVATGSTASGPAPIPTGACGIGRTGIYSNAGEVLYAGLAPGFPGLYQVNIRASPNLPSGQTSLRITVVGCYAIGVQRSPAPHDSNSVPLPVE